MKEMFAEVFASIRMNKQRSILAGVSTAWGIFMLIVLVGVGQGLIRGISSNYDYMSYNILHIRPGTTAMPFMGRQEGRKINLDENDAVFLKSQFPDVVSRVIPMVNKEMYASKGRYSTQLQVWGVAPGFMNAMYIQVKYGRDINDLDLLNHRKVCLLSTRLSSLLLSTKGPDALGQYVELGGVPFMVVGIYEPVRSFILVNDAFVPQPTATFLWEPSGNYDELCLFLDGLETKEANEEFNMELYDAMGRYKSFDSSDMAALNIEENMDFFLLVRGLLGTVSIVIWIIGLLALVSGIVGVGNIMFMSVKDRTFELGLRRVLGASDFSIMSLVLLEAIITMLIFGYVGMMAGIGVMRLVSIMTADMGSSAYNVFGSMDVEISMVLAANVVLVIGGLIAGWAPARQAIRMELTEALNS